ncbi:hypothetical protein GCM10011594_41530 [Nakamurella endophytica]|uniref:Uncharacterized protein n=1 Tax=Nakamurella endophytica TaxID=1748367 RepID=A0A917TCH4_9ACTN|nr:hypothetical protein GCM10011594_41530 [Nakamurella endophytica]
MNAGVFVDGLDELDSGPERAKAFLIGICSDLDDGIDPEELTSHVAYTLLEGGADQYGPAFLMQLAQSGNTVLQRAIEELSANREIDGS